MTRFPIPILCALLLSSPARAQTCVTRCGLKAWANCETLQATESAFLRHAAGRVDGYTPERVCAALKGWIVRVHAPNAFDYSCRMAPGSWRYLSSLPGLLLCVSGYTYVEMRVIETSDDLWHSNALPHELIHVVDVAIWGTTGHDRWRDRGVCAALKAVTGEDDASISSDCKGDE